MPLNKLTIEQIHQGLQEKKFSAREVTEAYLSAIRAKDQDINAFLEVTEETALAQAEVVDRRISQAQELPLLAGVPCAVKDNILIKGVKCTAGSKILKNYVAPYDATCIKKLKQQAVVFLGKTNLDEFAMGSSTENSAFKTTRNPYDLSRVPGGSSGGSAAAVAGGEACFALGSDTGGSIRQPASFCGVVGLKPSYGAVSRYGLIAFGSSLDQIGPLTKTVPEAEIVFRAIKGKDAKDSTMAGLMPNQCQRTNDKIKIGLPKEYFIKGIEREVEKAVRGVVERLKEQGAEIIEVSLPHTKYALACYYLTAPCEASANLARYDGIRYGECLSTPGTTPAATRAQGFGPEVKRRIMLGTYALSAGYYQAYYLKAQKVRSLIKQDFDKCFKDVDAILTPTSPTRAFKIGERTADPLQMYLADIFTVSVNLAGLPAMSIPAPGLAEELPVGVQIIAPAFCENRIFQIGKAINNELVGIL